MVCHLVCGKECREFRLYEKNQKVERLRLMLTQSGATQLTFPEFDATENEEEQKGE